MPFTRINILGSPNIGICCYANDQICFVPPGLNTKKIRQLEECLGVKVYQATVANSNLLGVFMSGNTHGLILPYIVDDDELNFIKDVCEADVIVAQTKYTAIGNLLLVNDKGGLIYSEASDELILEISRTLRIPIEKGEINHLPYVGTLAVATSKGVVTHQKIRETEKTILEDVLSTESESCTVNGGVLFPKTGMLANNNGVVVGNYTSGAEMACITRILKI